MPTKTLTTRATAVHERAEDAPLSDAEFFRAVHAAGRTPDAIDPRLRKLRSQNTENGSEGGFAMPETALHRLFEEHVESDPIIALADRRNTTERTYRGVLSDESSRLDGTRHGGITLPYLSESSASATATPKLRQVEMEMLKRNIAAVHSIETADDWPTLSQDLLAVVGPEAAFTALRGMTIGGGVGDALGFLRSGALLTQAIEATQTKANTATFVAANAAGMLSQVWRPGRAVFLLHQELYAQVITTTSASLIGPPTEFAPFGTLATRPMYPSEVLPAVGTVGDFVCANLSDYLLVTRGSLRAALSVHARFMTDEGIWKFSFRFNGQPKTSKPITPYTGALTRSPYVALAARA